MEAEILQLKAECDPVGPVVDSDGFPRADIDIPAIRTKRNRLAMLQNDHKALMADIESQLHELHAVSQLEGMAVGPSTEPSESSLSQSSPSSGGKAGDRDGVHRTSPGVLVAVDSAAMCGIRSVEQGSVAFRSGFLPNDELMQVAQLHAGSSQYQQYGMKSLVDIVRKSVHERTLFVVRRKGPLTEARLREIYVTVPDGPLGLQFL